MIGDVIVSPLGRWRVVPRGVCEVCCACGLSRVVSREWCTSYNGNRYADACPCGLLRVLRSVRRCFGDLTRPRTLSCPPDTRSHAQAIAHTPHRTHRARARADRSPVARRAAAARRDSPRAMRNSKKRKPLIRTGTLLRSVTSRTRPKFEPRSIHRLENRAATIDPTTAAAAAIATMVTTRFRRGAGGSDSGGHGRQRGAE